MTDLWEDTIAYYNSEYEEIPKIKVYSANSKALRSENAHIPYGFTWAWACERAAVWG